MVLTAAAKAQLGARAALAKKAEGLLVLDLQAISTIADYFVICSGNSMTQIQTIAEAIEASLKGEGFPVYHREGLPESGWLLLDYGDVVVHVFLPETRDFYALEHLWGDAPELPIEA
ncbi:MAG: ribosome silencing factor [Candidatus Rokubacteria bacterium]|nr:ribosome silencing factor [Candidatus Rokubacteria bacterium]